MNYLIQHERVWISNASQLNAVRGKVLKTLENMVPTHAPLTQQRELLLRHREEPGLRYQAHHGLGFTSCYKIPNGPRVPLHPLAS